MSNDTTSTTPERTEADRMRELAEHVVDRIEAEAAAVRKLQDAEGQTAREIRDDAEDGGNDVLREFMAAREVLELGATFEACADEDIAEGVDEWLDRSRFEGPLAIVRKGSNSGDGWTTDEVVIVLGTGGPHVQVEYEGTSATVRAYGWFKEGETTRDVDADAVDLLYGVDDLYRDMD